MKVKFNVQIGTRTIEEEFEFDDGTSNEELDEHCEEWAASHISYGWKKL